VALSGEDLESRSKKMAVVQRFRPDLADTSNNRPLPQVLQSNNSGEIELKPPSRGWPGVTLLENVERGTLPPARAMADFGSW
jgi:hypothetical protein